MKTRKQAGLYNSLKERKQELNKELLEISRKSETLLHLTLENQIPEYQKQFEDLSIELDLIEKLEYYYDMISESCY